MTWEGGQAQPFQRTDLFAGTPYRLVRRLGQTGYGEVFLVEHLELGREMVAKVLRHEFADDARLLDRVRLEATTLARLEHQNIVQITDFRQTADARPFIIVEYLEGRTLEEELSERGALGLFDALDYAHQALSGLAAAHALGIVHRDVTPHGLFLAHDRQGVLTLKVVDFGLARVLPNPSPAAPRPLSVPTESGALVGTPRYLSPESASGMRVDHRADLYAVALILYEMVAGRGPFDGLPDLLGAQRSEQPMPPSQLAQQPIPTEFDAVIQRGLRKAPRDRFQSAKQFQQELERLWHLLHHSHAFATTYFSVERLPALKTTGDLPKRAREPSTPAPTPTPTLGLDPGLDPDPGLGPGVRTSNAGSSSDVATDESASHTTSLPLVRRSKLTALSFAVALVTAVAVASGIVALFAKAGP